MAVSVLFGGGEGHFTDTHENNGGIHFCSVMFAREVEF